MQASDHSCIQSESNNILYREKISMNQYYVRFRGGGSIEVVRAGSCAIRPRCAPLPLERITLQNGAYIPDAIHIIIEVEGFFHMFSSSTLVEKNVQKVVGIKHN